MRNVLKAILIDGRFFCLKLELPTSLLNAQNQPFSVTKIRKNKVMSTKTVSEYCASLDIFSVFSQLKTLENCE